MVLLILQLGVYVCLFWSSSQCLEDHFWFFDPPAGGLVLLVLVLQPVPAGPFCSLGLETCRTILFPWGSLWLWACESLWLLGLWEPLAPGLVRASGSWACGGLWLLGLWELWLLGLWDRDTFSFPTTENCANAAALVVAAPGALRTPAWPSPS